MRIGNTKTTTYTSTNFKLYNKRQKSKQSDGTVTADANNTIYLSRRQIAPFIRDKILLTTTTIPSFTMLSYLPTNKYTDEIRSTSSSISTSSSTSSSLSVSVSKGNITGRLFSVTDPNTYSAIIYSKIYNNNNTMSNINENKEDKVPVLIVLHGAGKNSNNDAWCLTDPYGEHAGLLPSLIVSNTAPIEALTNFIIVTPYCGIGKQSFYDDNRTKLLQFIDWLFTKDGQDAGCPSTIIDKNNIFLFGFSDGATVAIELATTRRFKACIICAYGYSGILPKLALQRLQNIPIWVFHCVDDVIFPVQYSDQLVSSLQSIATNKSIIRYNRYDYDQEGFTGSVQGHSVGITASKLADIYTWMLSIP